MEDNFITGDKSLRSIILSQQSRNRPYKPAHQQQNQPRIMAVWSAATVASFVVSGTVNILGAAENGGVKWCRKCAGGKFRQYRYRICDNDAPDVGNTYSYDNTVEVT